MEEGDRGAGGQWSQPKPLPKRITQLPRHGVGDGGFLCRLGLLQNCTQIGGASGAAAAAAGGTRGAGGGADMAEELRKLFPGVTVI
jgi:hypothetical protein